MIPENEVTSLLALIERMEVTPPLTRIMIFYKERDRRHDFYTETKEQIVRKVEATRRSANFEARDRNHPVFGDTYYALGYQVRQLDAHLTDWLAWAHTIPPSPAKRILAILKTAKLTSLRDKFIAAVDRHSPIFVHSVNYSPPPCDPDEVLTWALQQSVPNLLVKINSVSDDAEPGGHNVNFEFCCKECGGFILHLPDDQDQRGPAVCKACGLVFGSYGEVFALCKHLAQNAVKND